MYRGLNAQGTRPRRKREGRSACSRMAAALSMKGQWREFLRELVLANQSTLTQRQAFAALMSFSIRERLAPISRVEEERKAAKDEIKKR